MELCYHVKKIKQNKNNLSKNVQSKDESRRKYSKLFFKIYI